MNNLHQDVPSCIATGDTLTEQNDTEAHVIPNAIGGRLKPKGVLSRRANSTIGDLVEGPFLKNYQSIVALIHGVRQRGDHPSYRVEAPDGKAYLVNPDGALAPGKPELRSEPVSDGERIEVVARTMKELRTLLGQVSKKYPHFDVEQAIQHAAVVLEPSPRVKISLSVGPNVYFPLAYASAATFNASRNLPVHPGFQAYYSTLKKGSVSLPPDTFYWEPSPGWVVLPNAGTHVISTIASPRLGKAITVLRLIGLPGVAVVTDYAGDRLRAVTYAVDVVQGTDIPISVDGLGVTEMSWSPSHQLGDNHLYELQTRRLNEVLQLAGDLGYIR